MKARPNQRKTTLKVRQKRRWTFYIVGGCALLGYFTFSFFFDTMGFMKYLGMKKTQAQMAEEIRTIQEENAKLKRDIDAVKHDPATMEQLARDRLGMVKQGETVFLIAPSNQPGNKNASEQRP